MLLRLSVLPWSRYQLQTIFGLLLQRFRAIIRKMQMDVISRRPVAGQLGTLAPLRGLALIRQKHPPGESI